MPALTIVNVDGVAVAVACRRCRRHRRHGHPHRRRLWGSSDVRRLLASNSIMVGLIVGTVAIPGLD